MKKQNDDWVRCPNCKHKLFKMVEGGKPSAIGGKDTVSIEIKCQSCKEISVLHLKKISY